MCSKWVFLLHQEPVVLCHLGMFDDVLLDRSWMPQVCLGGRHPLGCSWPGQTAAFPSLLEMLIWAGSRAGVRHRAAYQHLLPPECTHTGPLVSPSCLLPVSSWTEQAGGQHRMQRSVSPVLRDHLFLHLTQRGRQWGWVMLPCQPGTLQERSWSFVFLGVKGASSSLITFNWVRPGFRALVMQRWCLPKGSLDLPFFHLLKVITPALVLFSFQWCSK